jgi:hypothetical protein
MPYLSTTMSIKTSRFCNPADFIIKTVQAPDMVRPGLTMNELRATFDDNLKPKIISDMEKIAKHYDGIEARFSKIARERQVSMWFQYKEIFKRNMTYLLRNPRTMQALFLNIIIVTLFILALFYHIAVWPITTPPTLYTITN